jgi:3-methylcrotonyl-CoA carboxylase beta subunit
MRRIKSSIDTNSAEYLANQTQNRTLLEEFKQRQDDVRYKRADRDLERLSKQKKLTPRDRIELLLDPGTPFMEIATMRACEDYEGKVPGAGVIAGIGIINGREIMVHASDSTVKAGAWYPKGVAKSVRILEIAIENHLPVVHLVDSAGGFLPLQSELFPGHKMGGHMFYLQCKLSAAAIPQIAVVLGHCTAGGAYVPTLCDYSIMVRGTGGVFLGGPPLVKAATGEDVSAEELGGADVQCGISGTADYAVDSEQEGLALARELVGIFKRINKADVDKREPEEPFYDPKELLGVIPKDTNTQFDMREVIARIVDGSRFHEYKPDYGTTAICGYAYIYGYKVGIVGNNGVLFSDSAQKCTNFMGLCNRDRVPVVFLQNITGFMIGKEYEHEGITKHGAKMVMMQSNLDVPKFTVMVNSSYGAGNYAMCGRAYEPRFLFTWPQSKISVMGIEQAAKTLAQIKIASLKRQGKELSDEAAQEIREDIAHDYEHKSSAYYSTSEGWDDGIINPADTRNVLGMAISASLNKKFTETSNGMMRI